MIADSWLNNKHSEESKQKMSLTKIGFKHTLETRLKMSETRKGSGASWYGKQLSPTTKAKLSEIAKNRKKNYINQGIQYIYITILQMS